MAQRPSGGGQLDRIMRRLGAVTRFNKLGTPAPGRNLPQEGGPPGTNQPRPPSPRPATSPVQSARSVRPQARPGQPPTPSGLDTPLPEGLQLQLPEGVTQPGVAPTPVNPPATAPVTPEFALDAVTESPAVQFFRRYGIVPNFLSLQVITSRTRLSKTLGRPPTRREIIQDISGRDISGGTGGPPI